MSDQAGHEAGSPRGSRPLTAVVVGAGVAGLLAAHVACKHFDSVILLDGNSLEPCTADQGGQEMLEGAKRHRGIPQYMLPHSLVTGGVLAIEQLLPGCHDELVRRGGVPVDLIRDFRFFDFGAPYMRCPSSLKIVGASRHLIQSTLEDEVLRRNAGKLQARGGCHVNGLLWSDDKSSVQGVELGSGEAVAAEVVIVTSGRFCRLPQWLAAAGHAVPSVQRVDAQLTYVGRVYCMPPNWEGKWLGHVTYGRPDGLRGAGLLPIENGMWQMAVWGLNGVVPPMEEEAFLEYARTLPDDSIYQAIKGAEPLTPLMKHGGANNIQRGWDKIPLPGGLLVLGDAVQALNPVYAQGMSVAAMSAVTLDSALAWAIPASSRCGAEARRAALRSMGPSFQRQLAAVIAPAWQMATSEDLRYPGTKAEGVPRPPWLMSAYIDSLFRACHRDGKVADILFSVAHMVRPPHHLFHPRLLAAAARQALHTTLELLAAHLPSSSAGRIKKAG